MDNKATHCNVALQPQNEGVYTPLEFRASRDYTVTPNMLIIFINFHQLFMHNYNIIWISTEKQLLEPLESL